MSNQNCSVFNTEVANTGIAQISPARRKVHLAVLQASCKGLQVPEFHLNHTQLILIVFVDTGLESHCKA